MKKLAIQNLKGGSAKTTTSINLAHCLALMGNHVCIIDADVQGSIRSALQVRHEFSLYDLMIENIPLDEVIVRDVREKVDVIISDKNLARAEQALVSMPRREEILSFRLRGLVNYDYVIIDCAPSLSQMHHNVLLYVDELIIPISMDFLALMGSSQIFESIKMIRDLWEKDLRVCGILPTFVNKNQSMSRNILEAIQEAYGRFGQRILPEIRQDMNLRKSIAAQETIYDFLGIKSLSDLTEAHRSAFDYYQVAKLIVGEKNEHYARSEENRNSISGSFTGHSAGNVA